MRGRILIELNRNTYTMLFNLTVVSPGIFSEKIATKDARNAFLRQNLKTGDALLC